MKTFDTIGCSGWPECKHGLKESELFFPVAVNWSQYPVAHEDCTFAGHRDTRDAR